MGGMRSWPTGRAACCPGRSVRVALPAWNRRGQLPRMRHAAAYLRYAQPWDIMNSSPAAAGSLVGCACSVFLDGGTTHEALQSIVGRHSGWRLSWGQTETSATPQGEQPSYEGKTLSQWKALAKNTDPEVRTRAAQALGCIGPVAVPDLAKLLKDKDWGVRWAAASGLGFIGPEAKPPSQPLRNCSRITMRQSEVCCLGLGRIGPEAKSAVPALVEVISDRRVERVFSGGCCRGLGISVP